MPSVRRRRDWNQEQIQQKRYSLLECVYLLTGVDCERTVSAAEIAAELGDSVDPSSSVAHDLILMGYLNRTPSGELCITTLGVEFIQRDAWRRRSIRE